MKCSVAGCAFDELARGLGLCAVHGPDLDEVDHVPGLGWVTTAPPAAPAPAAAPARRRRRVTADEVEALARLRCATLDRAAAVAEIEARVGQTLSPHLRAAVERGRIEGADARRRRLGG